MIIEQFVALMAQFLAVAVVLTFHEFAHAYAAYKCGDPTAKYSGRMTLNPAKHFDALGLVMFTVAGFGWAKPVPVNPNNFDNYRKGSFWTSAAGILMNYAMAFVFYPLFYIVVEFLFPVFAGKYMGGFLINLFYCLYAYSLSFCVFNLLPFYPLDGFRIVDALNKKQGKFLESLSKLRRASNFKPFRASNPIAQFLWLLQWRSRVLARLSSALMKREASL
jgi:Zn-dependent protease